MAEQPTQVLTSGADKRLFVIRACLGRGGFGEVYRASMTNSSGLETDVAVKVLHPNLDSDTQAVQRLRDEGRMLGALVHPSIVRVYDLVILEGRVGLVTEFVDGQDLAKCIRGFMPLEPRGIAEVIGRVADALHAAWNTLATNGEPLHLIHRDIKPQNIRIRKDGGVKLLDFGVAHSNSISREAHTSTGHMVGSYLYMAPECLRSNQFSPASDIFALGLVLFESLAHRRLFEKLSLREMYVLVLNEARLNTYVEDKLQTLTLKPPMESLLRQMLSTKPDLRPTAQQVSTRCDDLADILQGPSLRRWCKARLWPEENQVTGILDGRTITEATMATSRLQHSSSLQMLTLLVGTTAGSFLALLIGGGILLFSLLAINRIAQSPAPTHPLVGLIPQTPISVFPTKEFLHPVRTEAAGSTSTPMKKPLPTSRLRFSVIAGNATLRLHKNGDHYYNNQRAPFGDYSLQVNWGRGFRPQKRISVRQRTTVIECNALTHQCH